MDQRAIAVNMVSMFVVLMLCVSVPCFFRYVRLVMRHRRRYISTRRFEMYRFRHRRLCNRLGWAVIAFVVICWGGAELGLFI